MPLLVPLVEPAWKLSAALCRGLASLLRAAYRASAAQRAMALLVAVHAIFGGWNMVARHAVTPAIAPAFLFWRQALAALALLAVVGEALRLRSIEVTERNPISSRSHAVCTLRFRPAAEAQDVPTTTAEATAKKQNEAKAGENEEDGRPWRGQLRLVDLAGSERNCSFKIA